MVSQSKTPPTSQADCRILHQPVVAPRTPHSSCSVRVRPWLTAAEAIQSVPTMASVNSFAMVLIMTVLHEGRHVPTGFRPLLRSVRDGLKAERGKHGIPCILDWTTLSAVFEKTHHCKEQLTTLQVNSTDSRDFNGSCVRTHHGGHTIGLWFVG